MALGQILYVGDDLKIDGAVLLLGMQACWIKYGKGT